MSWENVIEYRKGCKKSDDKRDAGLTAPEDVKAFRDIKYGSDPYNVLDVYVPRGTEEKLPAIISVHGGGWVYGDKELYQHYCMRLAWRGFAVVNFSYRLAPENRYPAALEDCFAVFRWIRENHERYFIDYDRMFMVGDSAGGQMALQCITILTNEKYRRLYDLDVPEDFRIRACGLNCGAYYLMVNRFMKPSDRNFMKDYLPEDYEKYIPQLQVTRNITSDFPPAFVMTAHNDFLKFMARPLYWKLRSKGVEAEYHIYGSKDRKDIGHVFHVNCRLEEADRCNDDECAFFRRHMD